MEKVKMQIKDNVMTIEGELDLEFDLDSIHCGLPIEDEKPFNKVPFMIKPYGEIHIRYLPALAKWLHKNSMIKSRNVCEWPKWKVTFERID